MADILAWFLVVYALVCSYWGLKIVRPPLMNWYSNQTFFVAGKGPVDILFKQIGMRISIEFFGFVLAVAVGSLGGAIYLILKEKKEREQSANA